MCDFGYEGFEEGTIPNSYNTVQEGYVNVSNNGILYFFPGTQNASTPIVLNKPMTLQAIGGTVRIGG